MIHVCSEYTVQDILHWDHCIAYSFATQVYDEHGDDTERGFLLTHSSQQKTLQKINLKLRKFRIMNILVCWVLLQKG